MLLMIDNYDSFTYNIVQYLAELGEKVKVVRNDKITVAGIGRLAPSRIVISPGPGRPEDAGVSCDAIRAFAGQIPILGVCLGHQAIGLVYGGKVINAGKLMHGKVSKVYHDGSGLFKGVEDPFEATRYHSLLVEKKTLPQALRLTAWTRDQEVMGMAHRKFKVFGVQFHPESVMTREGMRILRNFLTL
jgi:anthranilate synthase component II